MSKTSTLFKLWEKSCNGSEQAYAALHENLYPGLFGYSVKLLKKERIADDLLQNLFIQFWRERHKIGLVADIKTYFYQSVRFAIIAQLNNTGSQRTGVPGLIEPDLEFSAKEIILLTESNPGGIKRQAHNLNKLPAKQREVIYMRYCENMEYSQIAAVFETRQESIRNDINLAVITLRKEVNENALAQ